MNENVDCNVNNIEMKFEIEKNKTNNNKINKVKNTKNTIVNNRIQSAINKINKGKIKDKEIQVKNRKNEEILKTKSSSVSKKELILDLDDKNTEHLESLIRNNTKNRKLELIKVYKKSKTYSSFSDESITDITGNSILKTKSVLNKQEKDKNKILIDYTEPEFAKLNIKVSLKELGFNDENNLKKDIKNSKEKFKYNNTYKNYNLNTQLFKQNNNNNNFLNNTKKKSDFITVDNEKHDNIKSIKVFDIDNIPNKNDLVDKSKNRLLNRQLLSTKNEMIPLINDVLKINFPKNEPKLNKQRPKSSGVIFRNENLDVQNSLPPKNLNKVIIEDNKSTKSNISIENGSLKEYKNYLIENKHEKPEGNETNSKMIKTLKLISKNKQSFKNTNRILKDLYNLAAKSNSNFENKTKFKFENLVGTENKALDYNETKKITIDDLNNSKFESLKKNLENNEEMISKQIENNEKNEIKQKITKIKPVEISVSKEQKILFLNELKNMEKQYDISKLNKKTQDFLLKRRDLNTKRRELVLKTINSKTNINSDEIVKITKKIINRSITAKNKLKSTLQNIKNDEKNQSSKKNEIEYQSNEFKGKVLTAYTGFIDKLKRKDDFLNDNINPKSILNEVFKSKDNALINKDSKQKNQKQKIEIVEDCFEYDYIENKHPFFSDL